MVIFLYILVLLVNVLIIISDIKYKIIPNLYLFRLLLLAIIYFFLKFSDWEHFFYFFLTTFPITFIISFILYYYWIWAAWDAKYLLILSLFNFKTWLIPFLWNIWVIILFYMLFYFFYFYLYKCIFNRAFLLNLIKNIKIDMNDKIMIFFKNTVKWAKIKNNYIYSILKYFFNFLIFFIFIRLFRIEIIEYIQSFHFIRDNIKNYWSYFILWTTIISFYIFVFYRIIFLFLRKIFLGFFWKFIRINNNLFKLINLSIWICLLILIIIFDYYKNGLEVFWKLKLIFTLYLLIYILVKILLYLYKITFQIAEHQFININDLVKWEIVDKDYLLTLFWKQTCLWTWIKNISWINYNNPAEYFVNLENPLDEEDVITLKKIYGIVNEYNWTKNIDYKNINEIKILKTFAFAWYIFLGFLVTIFFKDNFSIKIIEFVFYYFNHHIIHN